MAVLAKLHLGDAAYNGHDMERACQFYSFAIEEDPLCFQVYIRRQEAYQRLGRFDDARKDLETVVEKTEPLPNILNRNSSSDEQHRSICNAEAVYRLADLFLGPLQNPKKAIELYTKALGINKKLFPLFKHDLKPRIAHMYHWRGDAFESLGDWRSAIDDYTCGIKEIDEWCDDKEILYLRQMRAYNVLGLHRKAEMIFNFLARHNDSASLYTKTASALYDVDPEKAGRLFSDAVCAFRQSGNEHHKILAPLGKEQMQLLQSVLVGENN